MSKDKATKSEVQTTPLNKMPAPELESETAAEIAFESKSESAVRNTFNKLKQ